MRKKIEKKFWDMEIIGNRRKIAFKVSKRARKCQDFFFPFSIWTTISFYYILLVDIHLLNSVPFTAS